MEKISTSIERAFNSNDSESLKEFYAAVSLNLMENYKNLRRAKTQLILFILAYFIVVQSSVESIEIGPFKVANIDIILKIFPLIISYKFYEFSDIQSLIKLLTETLDSVIKKLYPKIYNNNLETLMQEESSMSIFSTRNKDRNSTIFNQIRFSVLAIQFILLPIALIIYASYVNFTKFGYFDVLVWFILVLNVIFLIISFRVILIELFKQVE